MSIADAGGKQDMTGKYSLVMESGPTGYRGYVPELSSILVTSGSADELMTRATEAIQTLSTSELREIEVELPV
jgi:predicted RNase H-like HicB family nuclease